MANTYTQVDIQFVFSPMYRSGSIEPVWQQELYDYISGIVSRNKHRLLAINGMPDHVHILVGMRPTQSMSDLMQDIKGCSARWINEKGFVSGRFRWQEGFGGFSYRKVDVPYMIQYIRNQEEHHRGKSFITEYMETLKEFEIDYVDQYLFQPLL